MGRTRFQTIYFVFLFVVFTIYTVAFADTNVNQDTGGGPGTVIIGSENITVINNATPKSFVETAVGRYRLASFTEKSINGISQGIEIPEGELTINESFVAVWTVLVKDRYNSNNGPLKMTAAGSLSPQKIFSPIKGGEYNNTTWIGNAWQIDMDATDLVVRGWSPGKSNDIFQVSGEGKLLEMFNKRGSFTWVKY